LDAAQSLERASRAKRRQPATSQVDPWWRAIVNHGDALAAQPIGFGFEPVGVEWAERAVGPDNPMPRSRVVVGARAAPDLLSDPSGGDSIAQPVGHRAASAHAARGDLGDQSLQGVGQIGDRGPVHEVSATD
jgi:hypothetical protein